MSAHRAAFDHALGILKPDVENISENDGIPFGFFFQAELEDGNEAQFRFSTHLSFFCAANLPNGDSLLKQDGLPRNRAHGYRSQLLAWQPTATNPLTFRDFNRLLAAFSYNNG
jgi:hypothetical protein